MRPGRLSISGGMIETAWWGPGPDEAPTLVLLHEGLGCVALWRDVPERLAAMTGCGVFAYSRFGYGQSEPAKLPRPMTYMHEEAQAVLPEVLAAAGIRQAVLIGHSDGGSIAAIYAGSMSKVVPPSVMVGGGCAAPVMVGEGRAAPVMVGEGRAASVMVGEGRPSTPLIAAAPQGVDGGPAPAMTEVGRPAPTMTEETPPSSTASNPNLRALITIAAHFFVEDVNIASIRAIKQTYETSDLRARLARYHRDPDVAFRGWNDAWLDPRFRDFDITGCLPGIKVPVLALQGSDDPYGTEEQLHVMASHVSAPITTALIPEAKHAPHLEAKDVTFETIARFINENLP